MAATVAKRRVKGLGGKDTRVDGRACRTSAQTCPQRGANGVGRAVGQGRRQSRLAETASPARISGLTPPLGSRTLVCLDLPQPQAEQGLRKTVLDRRGVCLRGNDAFDGKALSPYPVVFRQSLTEVLGNLAADLLT